jgi:hypothetical protein
MSEKEKVLSEEEVEEKLQEMYRVLLGHDDEKFHKMQWWLFFLTEQEEVFGSYSKKLQDKMLACLDQYRIEHRYRCPYSGQYELAL